MKIIDLLPADRPREKLARYGAGRLRLAEIIAILIGTGRKGLSSLELARAVIRQYPGNSLASVRYEELQKQSGLGPTKAASIIAALELAKRLPLTTHEGAVIEPKDIWQMLRPILNLKKEHIIAFYLDARRQLISQQTISIGTVNNSLIHPREVFEPALNCQASALILSHNHPSGSLKPSPADLEVTTRLVSAGELLAIPLLDHLIVASGGYFSFREHRLLRIDKSPEGFIDNL